LVHIASMGCKLNQAEAESFAWQFLDRGCRLTDSAADADIVVLNTCTVTHVADRKCRQWLRAARRQNPQALLAAVGCYSHRAPGEVRQLNVADLVLDNRDKEHLVDTLDQARGLDSNAEKAAGYRVSRRARAFLKVQEGCNGRCSFCIVPYTRGRERSLPIEEVVAAVARQVDAGYREVVLTGTNIGAYRVNGDSTDGLAHLIQEVLRSTRVERVRLSSLRPQDITPRLVEIWRDDRICPHLHMSLQCGSQTVLHRMNRGYSLEEFAGASALLRDVVPDLAITTDVIVGFPGENQREFQESLDFCQRTGFARIHVFSYSARRGTPAAEMPDQVPEPVKKERSRRMLALAKESAGRYRSRFLGRTEPVLWERKVSETTWTGLTGNYLRVFAESELDLGNCLMETKLTREQGNGLTGELIVGG